MWTLSLGIIGLLNIVGGLFPIDLENVNSVASILHTLSGFLMIIAFVVAFVCFHNSMKKVKRFKNVRLPFTVFGMIGLSGIVLTLSSHSLIGLWQRMFYGGFFACLIILTFPILGEQRLRE